MLDDLIISYLADRICEYCGIPYISTGNEFDSQCDYDQCQDCNTADWNIENAWAGRYDDFMSED